MAPPRRSFLSRLAQVAVAALAPHVEVAQHNVIEQAKEVGDKALDVTIFVLVGLVGYVFAMLGLAWVLAPHLGMPGTFFAIGGAHIAVGVTGVIVRLKRKEKEAAALTIPEPERTVSADVAA